MKILKVCEETIDGYTVSKEVKKLWLIQLDIYKEIQRICEKHNIKYSACGGTLLGVVRHDGQFIPWDDDMDIMMPYDDYVRFRKIAVNELGDKYFLQSYQTEKGFNPIFSRVRNSRTTIVTDNETHYPNWNKGIYIDIFPTFNIANSKIQEIIHILLLCFAYMLFLGSDVLYRKNNNSKLSSRIIKLLFLFPYLIMRIFISREKIMSLVEKAANMYCGTKSHEVMAYFDIFVSGITSKKVKYPRNVYENLINHHFYDTNIYIPKEYDKALRDQYGNWKKFVIGKSNHKVIRFDADEK